MVLDALERRYGSHGLERLGGREGLRTRLQREPGRTAFAAILELGPELERSLRGTGD